MLSPAACCRFSGGEPRGRRGWACAVVPTLLLCLAVTLSLATGSPENPVTELEASAKTAGVGVADEAEAVTTHIMPDAFAEGSDDTADRRMGRKLLETLTAGQQRDILLAVKAGMLNDPLLATWTDNSLPCDPPVWDFITCTSGNVNALRINSQPISGTLAPEITSLSGIRLLELVGLSGLSGTLPTGLGSTPGLSEVRLGYLLLSGTIPSSTSPNHVMSVVSLDHNKLSGTLPFLNSIFSLDVSYNALSGHLIVPNLPLIASIVNLESNRISSTIPPGLSGLGALQVINLKTNRLYGGVPQIQLKQINVDNNPGICGLAPISGTSSNTSIPRPCGPCFDSEAGDVADIGCQSFQKFCFDENNLKPGQQGDMVTGYGCTACLDSAPNDGRDSGCPEDYPICDPTAGEACAGCFDSAEGAAPDLGCENQMDYLTGTRPAPICYIGPTGKQGGTFLPGHYPYGLYDAPSTPNVVCTVCADSESGSGGDLGCDATGRKFCLDWGPDTRETPNVMNNDGDYGWGGACLSCINDQSGDTPDTGCTDITKPYCLPVKSFFLPDEGEDDAGYCVACIATPSVSDVDLGCDPLVPLCVTSSEYRVSPLNVSGFNSFPITADASCFVCQDTNNSTGEDRGCTDDKPYCVFGRDEATGGGYGCSEFPNPQCTFYDEDVTNVVATCPTPLVIEAAVTLGLENCTALEIDVASLVLAMSDAFNIPICSMEAAIAPPPVGRHRRLLQDSGSFLHIGIRIFVADQTDFPYFTSLLEAPQFEEVVVSFFGELGSVFSFSAIISTIVLSSATSDPHFVTAQGNKFDFNGIAGLSYCILTDINMHVNARFMGADVSTSKAISLDKPDTRTWLDQVAVLYGGDQVLVDSASVRGGSYAGAVGTIRVNGEALEGHLLVKKLPSGITISRKKMRVLITVPELAVVEVEVVRAAFWEAGSGPGRNFINLQIKQFNGSSVAHGILGQHFAGLVADGDVAGAASDYATSGIFATDCRFNRFELA
eukprot:jgi/Mesvir1/9283/Mv04466-RA.2